MSCNSPSTVYTVQVWHTLEKKWISDNRQESDQVPVEKSDEIQFWKLQKEDEEKFAWSFYVEVDGKKLFVSYGSEDDKVTLEPEGVKTRFFVPTATIKGLVRLKTTEEEARYLKFVDGFVGLGNIDGEENSADFVWGITVNTEKPVLGTVTRQVKIRPIDSLTEQWIRQDLSASDPVHVQTPGSDQVWDATFDGQRYVDFYTEGCDNNTLYVSGSSTGVEMLTEAMLRDSGAGVQFEGAHSGEGYTLQMQIDDTTNYVTIKSGDTILDMTDQYRNGTTWEYVIVGNFPCKETGTGRDQSTEK